MLQRHLKVTEWIKKQEPYICCLQQTHFRYRTNRLKEIGVSRHLLPTMFTASAPNGISAPPPNSLRSSCLPHPVHSAPPAPPANSNRSPGWAPAEAGYSPLSGPVNNPAPAPWWPAGNLLLKPESTKENYKKRKKSDRNLISCKQEEN